MRRDAVLDRELLRKDPMRVLYNPRTVEVSGSWS